MNLSKVIKKLRRERDMTQEELADILSISAQAVSRWENGSTMPDISLIPSICNLFDISADYLLGVDVTRKEESIRKISEEASNLFMRGNFAEARKILEEGLYKYPNSTALMCHLMHVAHRQFKEEKKEDEIKIYAEEGIRLGEKILESSNNDEERHSAIQVLCFLYADCGEMKRARELADKMPPHYMSKDALMAGIERGTEKQKAIQNETWMLFTSLLTNMTRNVKLDDDVFAYSSDEEAILRDKAISFIHLFYEDGNLGHTHCRISSLYLKQAIYFAEKQDKENTLANLKKAVDSIIKYCEFVKEANFTNTNLLLRGKHFKFDSVNYLHEKENVQYVADTMNKEVFDFVRSNTAFADAKNKICKCAESINTQ